METTGAVLRSQGGQYELVTLEVGDPGPGEVLVEMAYAGLCHSDEHLRQSNAGGRYPIVGGHEGSGRVLAVGPGVSRVAPGDHVVASFLPACGTCRWCASGRSNLCNLGATIATGQLPTGTWPFRLDGEELGAFCMVGAFARHSLLHEASVIKIHPWLPLDTAALMACSVPTGWGSAVYAGGTRPGDTVVVVGCGGVGANAVQGAAHAGASHVVAVDPVAFRREFALTVGATHAVGTSKEAAALARELTWGNGADVVVLALGSTDPESTRLAARCLGKGGTLVLTALADVASDVTVSLQGNGVTAYEHRIQGALFGSCNAHRDVPMLLRLAEEGKLELDRLVTRRYSLDQLHQGFADQAAGETIRGLLVHAD
ncbi:NDMA-dependent alcohol dehydrogenase [Klenkia taihuensis]|uniref:S-(Hydroxymethyl)glutathione dehydrogenase / alcohol dehydrogenase n=1 Tax=Klenkia taihuensis TaxID=1225127 RepID=A0A1I1IFL1_9ACTN|nr:NDMA-dependent alcohol dehydrogenase [Klenkia taihuensis]GHE08796.1 alcohol dehydrogenase [Klenkia taihuensis]SFC31970.1 S-(hydroxymethyl)glutathione dehydrogenase / alcohol dehydrogenase [Klenkia taihuensis]